MRLSTFHSLGWSGFSDAFVIGVIVGDGDSIGVGPESQIVGVKHSALWFVRLLRRVIVIQCVSLVVGE